MTQNRRLQRLMSIVLEESECPRDIKWAKNYLQWMMDRLDACDTDSQTSNTKGEV